jgi:hypothetical protein
MMGCASGGVTSEMPARISLILLYFAAFFNAVLFAYYQEEIIPY